MQDQKLDNFNSYGRSINYYLNSCVNKLDSIPEDRLCQRVVLTNFYRYLLSVVPEREPETSKIEKNILEKNSLPKQSERINANVFCPETDIIENFYTHLNDVETNFNSHENGEMISSLYCENEEIDQDCVWEPENTNKTEKIYESIILKEDFDDFNEYFKKIKNDINYHHTLNQKAQEKLNAASESTDSKQSSNSECDNSNSIHSETSSESFSLTNLCTIRADNYKSVQKKKEKKELSKKSRKTSNPSKLKKSSLNLKVNSCSDNCKKTKCLSTFYIKKPLQIHKLKK
ncbi:hypothetical protein A3Q56_03880 [Intoshia linei]|uniref:Uncharacterized protein n=1 Tax=Intoshia linei TaxID=1819745 RepID=A0A177B2A4_9BILA|nr:hypothetical protein A3Q56_03880 [Intoshia linei]